ncbi:hypothetical protein OF83DRAFT_1162631 [Amylostereum chailletii]|nr:hypothetical protein OF83DRAFT_1162631 [Amylostereum chailletii]
MFKNPPSNTKTFAPLRSSDRRKLRQRVIQEFGLEQGEGDLLVPEGLLTMKISTYQGHPGVLYLSVEGDPLWFTIGKHSDELIPTSMRPTLLPILSTPSAVIPDLLGGTDLTISAVVQRPTSLQANSLVCVVQYERDARGPPLAVGRLFVDAERISEGALDEGKAVTVFHTWKDHLWMMGSKPDLPESTPLVAGETNVVDEPSDEDGIPGKSTSPGASPQLNIDNDNVEYGHSLRLDSVTSESEDAEDPEEKLTPEDISSILRSSLLQGLKTSAASLPSSALPMPASTFYSTHILPARPVWVTSATSPADIKHSAFKSLAAFLKQSEKQGLIRVKEARGDVVVVTVNPTHKDVLAHEVYNTVGELENRRKKAKEEEEKRGKEGEAKGKVLSIVELWEPHATTVRFFEEAHLDTSALYTSSELKGALNAYISAHDLVNPAEQQYINVGSDEVLCSALYLSTSEIAVTPPEFAKRDELLGVLCSRMQPWYRMQLGKREPETKLDIERRMGQLKPISVVVRRGRKASTFITGFEPFLLESGTIADALGARCASSTAISPAPGRAAGEKIMVRGKHIKAVVEFLEEMGIPKNWIQANMTEEKMKK